MKSTIQLAFIASIALCSSSFAAVAPSASTERWDPACAPSSNASAVTALAKSGQTKAAAQRMAKANSCGVDPIVAAIVESARNLDREPFSAMLAQYLGILAATNPELAAEVRARLADPDYFGWYYGIPQFRERDLRLTGDEAIVFTAGPDASGS